MLTVERLTTLLHSISREDTEYNCLYYIDNLTLAYKNPDFCSQVEFDFIRNILFWEINPAHDQAYPLTPTFCPGYRNRTLEDLLGHCFDTDCINLLIELRDHISLNSEILSRVNDILWCYKHLDREIRKQKINFAKAAIQHYIDSANRQTDRTQMITRLVRASDLAILVKKDVLTNALSDLLCQSIRKNLDINDYTDGTLRLLQSLYQLNPHHQKECLQIIESILNSNNPTPKMNGDFLTLYYDFFINHITDPYKKELYGIHKINSLLWFCNFHLQKKHCLMALNAATMAEQQLNKLSISKDKRAELSARINAMKKESNKLPSNMRWQQHCINLPIEDITHLIDNMKNLSPLEIFKEILSCFKSIDYRATQNSIGPIVTAAILPTPGEQDSLAHDKKPESLTQYSDEELIRIDKFYAFIRLSYSAIIVRLMQLLGTQENPELLATFFSILADRLKSDGLEEKEEVILHSIKHAISGDMCAALSIIIPQLEDFFRIKVQSAGHNTSIFTKENNIEALSMSQLFGEPEIASIFIQEYGYDTFCELYLLLLDKRCGNYRHRICHGKMKFSDFNSNEAFYVFGLCLYVIFKEFLVTEIQPFESYNALTTIP